ncbi:IS5/IS1182 family transposase [Sulfolobus tengchongensis]|uniref:IS5/IS1182 family transposase n=1 Tax=Sulfolobus tengchongensis TaxID=207809 RepID=A0AAX4L460_9CREN
MSSKDLFLLQIKPLIENDLRDVIEKTFSSMKTQRYKTILYFKLLIIMIVYTTSYRELIGLANAIIQHFLGVEKIPSKSAIHWFTKQNLEKANKLLIHIKLNDRLEENQLPTHNLIAKEKFRENVDIIDSFIMELPHGVKSKETQVEKLVLDLKEIVPERDVFETLMSLDEERRSKLLSRFKGSLSSRRFEGDWGKKRGYSWFGGKVFVVVSSRSLMVFVTRASVPDSGVPFSPGSLTLANRGFCNRGLLCRVSGGFGVLRGGVEFFGVYFFEHFRAVRLGFWGFLLI